VSNGAKLVRLIAIFVLCLGALHAMDTATPKQHHKVTKKPAAPKLPPLPSGPTGPIQQMPLDAIAPVSPTVTYEKGQLTIVAPNSTLADILRAVHKQTGAEIDVPDAKERVVTHLGPGPAQEVLSELLNGSRFNYVMLGSPQNPGELTRVLLVARSGPDAANRTPQPQNPPEQQAADQDQPADATDTPEAEATQTPEDTPVDPNADQPTADADQQNNPPGVKTPQELLQEMQQRQLQLQQQQQNSPGLVPRTQEPAQQQ